MEGRPRPGDHRSGGRAAVAGQPGGTGDNGVLPDDQPGSPLDGVWPPGCNDAAGEQAAAVRPTPAESAAGKPDTGDCRHSNGNREEAHKCPRLSRQDGKHSAAQGARNPRRRADPRGGSRGEGRGGEGPTWTQHVHGRIRD